MGIKIHVQTSTGGAYTLSNCIAIGTSIQGTLSSGAAYRIEQSDPELTITQIT